MSVVKRQNHTIETNEVAIRRNDGGNLLYSPAVVLLGHQGAVLTASFSANGSTIVSGGIDKTINLWNLPVNEEDPAPNYGTLCGHKGGVTSVDWMEDETILSCSADGTVGLWDSITGKRIRKWTGHQGVVNQIATTKNLSGISVGDDGTANIWDSRQRDPVGTVKTDYPLLSTTFNNQGTTFYIGGIDPTVVAYDVRILDKPLWSCPGQADSISSIAINNDDSVLVSRSFNGQIRAYSASSFIPEGIPRLNPHLYHGAPSGKEFYLIRACFTIDNMSILSGSEDHSVTSWNFLSSRIQTKWDGHLGTVLDVDAHPSGKIILSTSTDGTIIVREL